MTLSFTGAKRKPALDEGSFQQLLAAVYTVQQHNESQHTDPAATSLVLGAIAEIQSEIRVRRLNVAEGAALIAQRILALTSANGVSVSLVDSGYLDCVAETGGSAKVPGSSISSHSLVATERLKSGQLFQSENSQTDLRLDCDLCRETDVGSLVAAPILRFGEIAGLVEVRWSKPKDFSESELRAIRLMAGLITGTLERSLRIANAHTVVSEKPEQSSGVAATFQPQSSQARGGETSPVSDVVPPTATTQSLPPVAEPDGDSQTSSTHPEGNAKLSPALACRMCGRPFAGDEQFCGFCSMPRPMENRSEELQSKWASLWFMQRAQGALQETETPRTEANENSVRFWFNEIQIPELAPPITPEPETTSVDPKPAMWPRRAPAEPPSETAGFATPTVGEHKTFPFDDRPLLSERSAKFAKVHWRDAILATVVIALAYGVFTAWPRSAHQPTWFQSLMVRVGVMQAHTKVFAGAPDARVWIDVHTQLYYCAGEDLYGKTPDGEFTTQYNAQSDAYLPASNTACP